MRSPADSSKRAFLARTASLAAVASPLGALAQPTGAWPAQTVRIVVPFTPGGATDAFGRILARRFSEVFGRTFIIDNRAGANGNLGAASVANAAPDGNTLLLSTTGPLSLNKLLYRNTPFDPLTDFSPVALLADVPLLWVVNPAVPARNVKELIAHMKAQPGKVTCSNAGKGSMGHLAGELLQRATGTQMLVVPYKGSSLAVNALLAGEVDASIDLLPTYLPHIAAGKLRPIATLGGQRSPALPNVSTLVESGIPAEATGWFALVAPKGTPAPVIAALNKASNDFLASAEGRAQLQTFSMRPIGGQPAALGKLMASEMDKWRPIVEPFAASIME